MNVWTRKKQKWSHHPFIVTSGSTYSSSLTMIEHFYVYKLNHIAFPTPRHVPFTKYKIPRRCFCKSHLKYVRETMHIHMYKTLPFTFFPPLSHSSIPLSILLLEIITMVDHKEVCCMCGDVGFPDKLFQCTRCLSRFQHTYCGNYYEENTSDSASVCDWCFSTDQQHNNGNTAFHYSKKASGKEHGRSDYVAGERIKQRANREEGHAKSKSVTGATNSAAKSSGRRYKLLKDVLC